MDSQVVIETDILKMAAKLDAGVPTVRDILAALAKPGRDPREDLPAPLCPISATNCPLLIEREMSLKIHTFPRFNEISWHSIAVIFFSLLLF